MTEPTQADIDRLRSILAKIESTMYHEIKIIKHEKQFEPDKLYNPGIEKTINEPC